MSCGSFRFLCATLATSFFVAAIAARGGVLREQAGDFGVEDRPSLLRQDYAPNWPLSSSGNEDRIAATVHLELPELTIVYTNGEVVLQWPLLTSDWALEQSSVLHPTAWFSVPLTSARTNGPAIAIALPPDSKSMFFRLRKLPSAGALLRGISADWKFDEGFGQVAEDYTGYHNTATLSNVTWVAGRVGSGALWFNGDGAPDGGSGVWVDNSGYRVLPRQNGKFSVALWFAADALTDGSRAFIGNDLNGINGWRLALHQAGPGTNELVFASAKADLNVRGRKLLLPGQWYQLTATYDGQEGVLYLDGELLARGKGAILSNNDPIYIGGAIGGLDTFFGRLDEVRVYTNALTHEDVALTGQWQMDENSGRLVADSSIHGHHGILLNSIAWTAGKNASGLALSNNALVIPNDFSDVLPPTGRPFSISFWLYPYSLSTNWSGLMSCADRDKGGWQLALLADSQEQTRLHFWSTNTGGTLDLCVPVSVPDSRWSKVDITFDGGIAILYVNGQKVGSASGGIQGAVAPLTVGPIAGLTNFNGVIDELKVYSRALTAEQVGPVSDVMWETALLNTATNLTLQGAGPSEKQLYYTIIDAISPTNGTIAHEPGSRLMTYTAGSTKGPDAFAYTVSDGEFTSQPAIVVMSVVQPHWLSPTGGSVALLDGRSPESAWAAGSSESLDTIWRTNNYYDCFFYGPGEYHTTGSKWQERRTANPGCKHIGSGCEGSNSTTIKLVDLRDAWKEEFIFADWSVGAYCDGFEVHNMVLDCNASNNPKYAVGEPVSIVIPLITTSRVDSLILHWDDSRFNGVWRLGPANSFSISSRIPGTSDYVTNYNGISSTGQVDTVALGIDTDQIVIRLERRAAFVDFYALTEIEMTGGLVSLPSATIMGGDESNLEPSSSTYTFVHAVDGNSQSVWASGREQQVRIALPLNAGSTVSHIIFSWNCQTVERFGRLGPAAHFRIQTRDPGTLQYHDVGFVRQPRSATGTEIIALNTLVSTDELIILLDAREPGVDFYSLRDLWLWNGLTVPLKIPTALNNLSWGSYDILRAFDREPYTQWASDTQGMVGAMDIVGNNLKFTGLRIIGFGTKATRECFPMFLHTPPSWAPPVKLGNVLVENCLFTDPAADNSDGLTAVTVLGVPPHILTNAVVRRTSVVGVKRHFTYTHGFSASTLQECVVDDCQVGVYFEPNTAGADNVGPILVRSNRFLNVDNGVYLAFAPAARFDSLTCLDNEVMLSGAGGWGFFACDTCSGGPSGSITNVTIFNNIIRYPDWSLRPSSYDGGLYCSDMQHSVFGNNVVVLGTVNALRLRSCPSGFIPPPRPTETCDGPGPIPPETGPTYPPCLNTLPTGYRRAWFNNRDISGTSLKVRYWNTNSDGFASQQQWP